MNKLIKWWAATADFKAVHIGKVRRRHLWEQTTFLLKASSEEEARNGAIAIAKSKEHIYTAVGGDQIHWQFTGLTDLKELLDSQVSPGMEVSWKFFERIDKPGNKNDA